jgi:N-acyl-D-aspartate/D-glutamate deacylase
VGRTLADLAAEWGTDAASAAIDLLRVEQGSVAYIGFAMSEENVERVLSHPLVMIGTDGNALAPTGPAASWKPHPRCYGSCARVLGHYARERGLFDLATAVRKMTAMPADHLGLADRGRLEVGRKADLVLFDAGGIADLATFDDPHRYPAGIRQVLVNGEPVVADGAPLGTRPGRALRSV